MAQIQFIGGRYVCRWAIWKTFSHILHGKFSEGSFSLMFFPGSDSVSFHWKRTSDTKTPEINFMIDMKIEGERGEFLLDRSWEVNSLRCGSVVVLSYHKDVKSSKNWTNVNVEIRDVTRIDHSGKTSQSHIIRGERDGQRPASISVGSNVETETQSGKKSDPIKPVVKTELVKLAEGQVGLKASLSAVDSASNGQPPAKRPKIAQSSAVAVDIDVNSAAAAIAGLSAAAKLFADGYRRDANDVRLIQDLTTKISQLTDENDRLNSTLSRMRVKLADTEDEAIAKMTEKAAELSHMQLNCEKLELERKTQVDLIAQLQNQLNEKSEVIEKINENNDRLASNLSRMRMKLADTEDEAKAKVNEKTAELSHLLLKCDRLELEYKTQVDLAAQLQYQLNEKSEAIDKLSVDLRVKSNSIDELRNNLALRSTQLRKELESVKSLQSELELTKVKLFKLTSDLSKQQQLSGQNLEAFKRQSHLIDEKFKLEQNLRAQLVELKKVCEGDVVKLLSLETLPFAIRLANQLSSDLMMTKIFEFVKKGKASEQMWKDLGPIGAEFPNLFAQICAFSGSAWNAKCPKFHFAGVNKS